MIQAEPTLLRQVLQNLLSNAIKFNHSARKRVELGWHWQASGYCELSVSDNGIGIDSRYHEHIFRVSHRLHTQQEYVGTGIGLAVVKKAVSRMGGHIRLVSTPGKGSTFYITLPAAHQE